MHATATHDGDRQDEIQIPYKYTASQDENRQLRKPQLLIKPPLQEDRWQDAHVCVVFFFPETAVAVMFDDSFPGVASRGTAGILLWLCIAEGPEKKRSALTAVFIYAQVSVPAYKPTCHAMPLSRPRSAVNLPLRLEAVGMERDKGSPREAEAALTRMHSSHTDGRPTPRLNKKKGVFTFLCIHPLPVR